MNPAAASPLLRGARWLGRLLLSALFAWAALEKFSDPQAFAADIANYRVVAEPLTRWLAVGLPAFELVLATGLLLPQLYRGSALLTGTTLWVFAIAMAQAKARGIDLDCGCFGSDTAVTVGADTIIRNLVLGGIGLWLAFQSGTSPGRAGGPAQRSTSEAPENPL